MQVSLKTVLVLLVFLGPVLLAGCTQEPPTEHQSVTLLQQSATIGDELYRWGDTNFSPPGVDVKRGRANISVPPEIGVIGISFKGTFQSEGDREATLEIHDADGQAVVELHAAPGGSDDHGTITDIWWFRSAHDVAPGRYNLSWSGTNVQVLEFTVHGISTQATEVEKTFTVPKSEPDLELELSFKGWGAVPQVVLIAPDGDRIEIEITDPTDLRQVTVTPKRGTYTLHVDTTGWGGNLLMRAVQ